MESVGYVAFVVRIFIFSSSLYKFETGESVLGLHKPGVLIDLPDGEKDL